MAYVDTDEVRDAATQMTPTALDEHVLESLIDRASRIFDLICGVEPGYFEPIADGAEASARTIYGNGGNYLRLPPYVAGTLATVTWPTGYTSQTYIERDGYLVRVTDGLLASALVRPVGWYEGVPITVTAIWGYATTPEDVKHAVIELVINLWRETDPAQVKLVNIEGQPLREKMPPRVNEVAKRYRAREAVFA